MRLVPLLTLCALLAVPVATAGAYVAPGALLVSASPGLREQGDDASSQPDLSGDGRYVVFTTASRNLFPPDVIDPGDEFYEGGVFRRDLVEGGLELVALGGRRDARTGTLQTRGAASASVSADGRWVAFSTAEALVAADDNQQVDVYVRDMAVPRRQPGAYELISARDGSDAPGRFERRAPAHPYRDPGADIAPGAAISDDGRLVVFAVTEVATDLPDRAAVDVPPGQIFVRDRARRETRLVTRVAGSAPAQPVASGSGRAGLGPAVISADGSTVAWAGQEAQQQTRFLPGEGTDPSVFYYLWQRIADGPGAATRRITGQADVDDPACTGFFVASASARGPCYGPLADSEQGLSGITAFPPALSGDGRRVAFLTQTAPRGEAAVAAVDLFVTDMTPGVSRKAGTQELTREGTSRDAVASASLTSVALSASGRFATIVTPRTRFVGSALRYLGDARSVPGAAELYVIDLAAGTFERATRSLAGGDAADAVASQTSIASEGQRVAFASGADNLFFGDANQRPDVFTIDRLDAPPPAAPVDEPPIEPAEAFATPPTAAPRRLSVFVRRAPRAKVRLEVRLPEPGAVAITVRGRVPDRDGRLRGPARTLGSLRRRVNKRGTVRLDVAITKRHRSSLRRARSIDGRAVIVLTPRGGAPLRREITVRYRW